jgi:DNA (cytosine-5)-methyltransferase 1
MGYGVGAADLCAAGVGAPHIRQRLYWMAYSDGRNASAEGLQRGREHRQQSQKRGARVGLADPKLPEWRQEHPARSRVAGRNSLHRSWEANPDRHAGCRADGGRLADTDATGQREQRSGGVLDGKRAPFGDDADGRGTLWGDTIWIPCADGKARRIEPGLEPLVNGLPGRVGLLRGYGNAIVPQVAATFIKACM